MSCCPLLDEYRKIHDTAMQKQKDIKCFCIIIIVERTRSRLLLSSSVMRQMTHYLLNIALPGKISLILLNKNIVYSGAFPFSFSKHCCFFLIPTLWGSWLSHLTTKLSSGEILLLFSWLSQA